MEWLRLIRSRLIAAAAFAGSCVLRDGGCSLGSCRLRCLVRRQAPLHDPPRGAGTGSAKWQSSGRLPHLRPREIQAVVTVR